MSILVKSDFDGYWYYQETEWKMIQDCISDALDMFSENDTKNHPVYHLLDDALNEVLKNI